MRYLILSILLFASTALGAGLDKITPTPEQYSLYQMRTVTSSDTELTAATRTWTNISSSFYYIDPGWKTSSISFIAYGDGDGAGDPVDGSFSYKVFMCRPYSSAKQVCFGDATVGTLQASHNPETGQTITDSKWVELPTVTSTWRVAATASGTTNDIGNVNVVTTNEFGIYVEVTSLTDISTLTVFITGCNDISTLLTSPVKTSALTVVDAWQIVDANTTTVGNSADFSDGYSDGIFYIEVAQVDANAHAGGAGIRVQTSTDGRSWVWYTDETGDNSLTLTGGTAVTTTTVGNLTVDVNTVVGLSDAATGAFDVQSQAWFIKDPNDIKNSEVVFTLSAISTDVNDVTIMNPVQSSHVSGASVYDIVDQFTINIRGPFTYVRAVYRNEDLDAYLAVRSWPSKVTAQ